MTATDRMPVTMLEGAVLAFADRLAAGDLAGALSLYEDDALLLPDPDTVVSGTEGLRAGLAGYVALRRQADGTWRFLVDNPWGTSLLGPEVDREAIAAPAAAGSEGRA